jgi:hypothetical protein
MSDSPSPRRAASPRDRYPTGRPGLPAVNDLLHQGRLPPVSRTKATRPKLLLVHDNASAVMRRCSAPEAPSRMAGTGSSAPAPRAETRPHPTGNASLREEIPDAALVLAERQDLRRRAGEGEARPPIRRPPRPRSARFRGWPRTS